MHHLSCPIGLRGHVHLELFKVNNLLNSKKKRFPHFKIKSSNSVENNYVTKGEYENIEKIRAQIKAFGYTTSKVDKEMDLPGP